jgi:hypothetical protein
MANLSTLFPPVNVGPTGPTGPSITGPAGPTGPAADTSGFVTTTGSQTLTNKTLSGPTVSGVVDVSGSTRESIVSIAALDVDCSLGNYFTKTISSNSTFTFSNAPSSRAFAFTLKVVHTSGTITWPAAVKWPGNTAPTLTTGRTHLFVFSTEDAGSTWRGSSAVDYTA